MMKIFKRNIQEKYLFSAILTLVFFVLILPINEAIAFSSTPLDHKARVISYLLKLLFAPVLFFICCFAFNFIQEIKRRNVFYMGWFKLTLLYFLIMLVFFFILYPGHWVGDEFHILDVVKSYGTYSWQNFFTNIYYTFCLYIIPSAIGIVIIQMMFVCTIVGYVISRFRQLFINKKISNLLILVFLLFPVIINNFYPLRLTVYSYVELLFLTKFLFLYLKPLETGNKVFELIGYSILITLLAFWRTEGIYYLVLLPFIVVKLGLIRVQCQKRIKSYASILLCVIIVCVGFSINKLTTSPMYQITASLNPLSTMIQHPLKGNKIQENLNNINAVVDLGVLRKYPSYTEIPAFWNGAVRGDYALHLSEYNKSFLYVVAHNPKLFLENRIDTFLASNSFGNILPLDTGLFSYDPTIVSRFEATNYLSSPINLPLKLQVTRLLVMSDENKQPTFMSHFVWNIIPIFLLLVIVGLWKIIRRQYIWFFVIALILLRPILLFFAAPASYFMYYLPTYLSGSFIITLTLLLYVDKKHLLTKFKGISSKIHNRVHSQLNRQ